MKRHKVQEGDCISSIADRYGFSVDSIWNLSDNSTLKEKRKDPNTLVPGDIVVVPDLKEKTVSCETAKIHRFKLSAETAVFRVQLFEDEQPLASQTCEVRIDRKSYTGTTDDQGILELSIPCTATVGTLLIAAKNKEIGLRFGYLQPINEKQGLEDRLRNLGFTDTSLEKTLLGFQKRFNIEQTGKPDQTTLDKITEIHDTICAFPQ